MSKNESEPRMSLEPGAVVRVKIGQGDEVETQVTDVSQPQVYLEIEGTDFFRQSLTLEKVPPKKG